MHAAIANSWNGNGSAGIRVQAGGYASAWLSIYGTECEYDGYCGEYEVDSATGWINGSGGDGQVYVFVHPPLDTVSDNYAYYVNMCSMDWDTEYGSCESGPWYVEVDPAPPPPPPPPPCTLDFQYRRLDFPLLGLVVGHSYLHFTQSDGPVIDYVFEGEQSGDSGISGCSGALVAWAGPHGLEGNHPVTDASATTNGPLRGAYVCDWRTPLQDAVSRINAAHIPYACTGPNSNSVARYMLSQLPTTFTPWWTYPGGLTGFYTLLPGVEQ